MGPLETHSPERGPPGRVCVGGDDVMGNDLNEAVVRRFVEEVANRRDTSVVADLLTEDFRLPPGADGLDRDGLVAVLEYYFAAFPDLHYTIEDLIADGNKVVVRVEMTGTHEGDYEGVAGSGKRVSVQEVDLF